jgi:hypothetical protein
MELTGQRHLAIDRDHAWRALNDPEVLKACIPGCESIEKAADNEYRVVLAVSLGPVRAKFRGKLFLEDVVAPERYTLRFEGEGGAAGFAKGTSKVALTAEGESTVLDYSVHAQIAGRIAQLGSRLVDSAAKKLADDFFAAFETHVGGVSHVTPSDAATAGLPAEAFDPRVWTWIAWMVVFVVVMILAVIILR